MTEIQNTQKRYEELPEAQKKFFIAYVKMLSASLDMFLNAVKPEHVQSESEVKQNA